ncbi:hypothetical protein PVAP13_5NG257581 [Panicum virgatum]|uniref:Uncharacterized protein n=1 Tax=Panicum virgatum TaxID=38727 RepID=A0A8T0RVL1_PANVG|nr:hypothetical protein PVAP13_5NG257581 [Panicum virgatum]
MVRPRRLGGGGRRTWAHRRSLDGEHRQAARRSARRWPSTPCGVPQRSPLAELVISTSDEIAMAIGSEPWTNMISDELIWMQSPCQVAFNGYLMTSGPKSRLQKQF